MPNTTSWLRSIWPSAAISTILFILGSGLLFWNEGRSVKRNFSLVEAINDAITIDPNIDIDSAYSKRLVHFYGPIITGEPLTEPDYNIQVQAVKLKRKVQMYQWLEETVEHNYGGSVNIMDNDERTYYYTQSWEDHIINSRLFASPFNHRNPEIFPIQSHIQLAETVTIGKYELGKDLKIKFDNFQNIASDQRPEDPSIKLHQGFYFHSNDVFNPEIGDLRLMFSAAGMEGEYYTVVGCFDENNKVVPYYTSYKTEINFLFTGKLKLTEVFNRQHKSYRFESWILRFIGWAFLFIASVYSSPLLHIAIRRIRFLSSYANESFLSTTNIFMISISLSLIIISIAWIMHRSWFGGGLLLAAFSPVMYTRHITTYHRLI